MQKLVELPDATEMGSMAEEQVTPAPQVKWTGGVHLVLNCPLESAWALQSDFGGLKKLAPMIIVCDIVEGKNNEVGCLRHCIGSNNIWVHERLLEMNEEEHEMSYHMEKNHFVFRDGLQGYISKVKLEDAGKGKTLVHWTYSVDPVATQTQEELTTFMTNFYTQNLKLLETAAANLAAPLLKEDAPS